MTDEDLAQYREELWHRSHAKLDELDEERARWAQEAPGREERIAQARAARERAPRAEEAPPRPVNYAKRRAEEQAHIRQAVKDEVQVAVQAALTRTYDWLTESIGMVIAKEREQARAKTKAALDKLRVKLRTEFDKATIARLEAMVAVLAVSGAKIDRLAAAGERLADDDAEPGRVNGTKPPLPH